MSDYFSPTMVAQQALDAAAIDFLLGNIEEGTRQAQVCLRAYGTCLKQMLRGAHWDFARRSEPLLLLADGSGQTVGVGSTVPGGRFIYEYGYPTDCAKLRYIPWWPFVNPSTPTGNITPPSPSAPVVTNLSQPPYLGLPQVPAPFLITSDPNYIPNGAANDQPGIAPTGRTVILTNVQNAQAIYTYEATYPNLWDEQFRAALVAYIASEIALPLATDKKFGLQIRDENIKIAMNKVREARVTNGNETWASSDIGVDWMRTRMVGGYATWNGSTWNGLSPGMWWGGWDSIGFANGSAF